MQYSFYLRTFNDDLFCAALAADVIK